MEQSMHKKVYINPNFKRNELDFRSTEPKTTHFNRHYLEEKQNREVNIKINPVIPNNRKIYVNPNFLSSNNTAQNQSSSAGYYLKTNENVSKVPNMQLLHKSKYSLVQNVQQTMKSEVAHDMEIKKNAGIITSELKPSIKKVVQGVPLTRSRYCIVRRKTRLSVTKEYKSVKNIGNTLLTTSLVPSASNNLTFHSNINAVKNKINNNTPEKITKIKITKHKMVPISYLKKNTVIERRNNKFVSSSLKSYLKGNSKLSPPITFNKNKFKFIKTKTIISTSRNIQHKEQDILCSGNKIKLSRAKFNINNIPCRLFTKYGKCLRQAQGNCSYLHDRKHVSLCRKFLKGVCHDKSCTLSHELTHKKMPTCFFYLHGMCNKEYCPYLHVKLSDKTKICQEFLKGYCESGDKCLFRHVVVDKLQKANNVSPSNVKKCKQRGFVNTPIRTKKKNTNISERILNLEDTIRKDNGDCRYYQKLDSKEVIYETVKPKRCKLGTLPSFIQL